MNNLVLVLLLLAAAATPAPTGPAWLGFANNAQHTASAASPLQALRRLHWRTVLDRQPQGALSQAHYASPVLTAAGTVLVAIKVEAVDGWRIHAGRLGEPGLLWHKATDYVTPPHHWAPAFPMTLAPGVGLYAAAAGGTVMLRHTPDAAEGVIERRAFYGLGVFNAQPAVFTGSVMIDTPITADPAGDIFFGFVVTGANPAGLLSGIARLSAAGAGSWIAAGRAAGDPAMTQVAMGCAPALSPDGSTLYIAVSNGAAGALVGLDAATLQPKYHAALLDPASGFGAWVSDDSSASPTVGPDGDVYYGVLETPFPSHNDRGWLLHFDPTLRHARPPGSFGWDETASVLPAADVPAYHGASSYLLVSRANNYLGIGSGDGHNRIAVLDPQGTAPDPILPGVRVMQAVESVLDPGVVPGTKDATYPWIMNSAAVEPVHGTVLAESEDGSLYAWDTGANLLSQRLSLPQAAAQGQADTPTVIGPDGEVYAIAGGDLIAVGQ